MSFVPYPEITSPDFFDNLYRKKEFFKTRTGPEFNTRFIEDVCNPREFRLQNHQEFARNFISPDTPYNSVLLIHGTGVGKTCAAISITEGLKDYIHKMGKKIYIIASEEIQKNFKKELYSEQRERKEIMMHSPAGSHQCAGDAYYVNEIDPEKRRKLIARKIKKYYEFFGSGTAFPTFVDVKLRKQLGSSDAVVDYLKDSVIVIDEAHGITRVTENKVKKPKKTTEQQGAEETKDGSLSSDDSDEFDDADIDQAADIITATRRKAEKSERSLKTLLLGDSKRKGLIQECIKRGGNLKLILLTATPMKDRMSELADLLAIMRANDSQPFNARTLFPSGTDIGGEFNEEYLREVSKGYVSFVRGNNPVSFPQALLPDSELYEPAPVFAFDGKGKEVMDLGDIKYKYNLSHCPMSIYQYSAFCKVKHTLRSGVVATIGNRDTGDNVGKELSNFAFPSVNVDKVMLGEDFIVPSGVTRLGSLYGTKGFNNSFTEVNQDLVGMRTKVKKHRSYEYKNIDSLGFYLMLDNPINPECNLDVFSRKFANIIRNINQVEGVTYCYSERDLVGAQLLSICLEANGFIRYHPETRYNENGLPTNLDKILPARLLSYSSEKLKSAYKKHLTKNFRCVCGRLYKEHTDDSVCKKFVQATYIVYSGKIGKPEDLETITHPNNKNGHMVKCIVGTKKTGQGIDFKWVRQVHIVDPWYNNTRIFQAIGRGIRNCSHAELPPEKRNVTIFKYSATIPTFEKYQIKLGTKYSTVSEYLLENKSAINYANKNLTEKVRLKLNDESNHKFKAQFTYKDLLTETTDEKMYSIVISKDVYVKKIERVLKSNAIDCQFNKHMNYYGERDVDYTRDCDYQKCNYVCHNGREPYDKLVDVYMRNQKDSYLIKSQYFLGDTNWHDVKDITRDKYENIVRDPEVQWNLDTINTETVEPNIFGQNLFDEIQKLVGPALKIDGYKNETYEVYYEKPILSLDLSTYNIHFAKPQITKARMIIASLYLHNVALTEDVIIRLVKKKNPILDIEFIRLALDELIGKPPYVMPKIIKDRFGQESYLIYISNFYVLQPAAITNKRISLYYRGRPSPINRADSNIDDMIPEKTDTDNKHIIDEPRLKALIYDYADEFKNLDPTDTVRKILLVISLRSYLDRMVLTDQEWVFHETTKLCYMDRDEYQTLFDALLDYYEQQHLVMHTEKNIYTLFHPKNNELQVFKIPSEQSEVSWKKTYKDKISDIVTDQIDNAVTSQYNTISGNAYCGIYGFISDRNTKRKSDIIKDRKFSYEKINKAIINTNKTIRSEEDVVFKIININSQKVTKNASGRDSVKSKQTGGDCKTAKYSEETFNTLHKLFESGFKYEGTQIDNSMWDDEELELPKPGKIVDKHVMCRYIEKYLRVLDYVKYNPRLERPDNIRWFMTGFEIEYYRPSNT